MVLLIVCLKGSNIFRYVDGWNRKNKKGCKKSMQKKVLVLGLNREIQRYVPSKGEAKTEIR
jgi:hypothetical protein